MGVEHAKSLQSYLSLCDPMDCSPGFSRQEHHSGLPCPSPEDFAYPGIEPVSLISPTLAGGFFITSAAWEAPFNLLSNIFSQMLES